MEIKCLENEDLAILQRRYIEEILDEFGMEDCNPALSPVNKRTHIELLDEGPGLPRRFHGNELLKRNGLFTIFGDLVAP